ncbi:three-prime repair exonuclease 1-like [Pectinophora gossypiella]|uniref:three-prime repair exonuclease 1-like n=1 Tax=Pectinophora gossypiella TaxID=13191 RepID=UPI00214EBE68|nr:three-prime repair exonuclease 1-like [Pectinophora gossypiella]
MAPIATYVFIDLETTGIPKEEFNKTRITELSLVAVKREHLLATRPGATPRVLHKLTLCLNPGRPIHPDCTEVTGLCNFLLEDEPTFKQVSDPIISFINLFTKPVCLIAQNGLHFDFPILKNHFEKLNVSLSDDILCADCYHGFYDILEEKKKITLPEATTSSSADGGNQVRKQNGTSIDDVTLLAPNTLPMKLSNETTPKQSPKPTAIRTAVDQNRVSKARRRFPFSKGEKPTEKYKLKAIYERVLNRPAIEAHRAENDCILALEVSAALAQEFVKWVDENYVPFSIVKPMTIGVPLGE